MDDVIPKEKLTAYERWELAAFDETRQKPEAPTPATASPPEAPATASPPEAPASAAATGAETLTSASEPVTAACRMTSACNLTLARGLGSE